MYLFYFCALLNIIVEKKDLLCIRRYDVILLILDDGETGGNLFEILSLALFSTFGALLNIYSVLAIIGTFVLYSLFDTFGSLINIYTLLATFGTFVTYFFPWNVYHDAAKFTDKLRIKYKENRELFNVEESYGCCSYFGLRGLWKMFYWKYIFQYLQQSRKSYQSYTGVSGEKDKSTQADDKPDVNHIELPELKKMCLYYGRYELDYHNFCNSCGNCNLCKGPIMALIVLEWKKVEMYESDCDWHQYRYTDILNVAVDDRRSIKPVGGKVYDQLDNAVYTLDKYKESACLVLFNFPKYWQTKYENKKIVKQIKDVIKEVALYYECSR